MRSLRVFVAILFIWLSPKLRAQEPQQIQWIDFQQLEKSLAEQPKKVFIYFYADWCAYCKKMNQAAFKNSAVIDALNTKFYAVKMNAESTDTIRYDGQTFINEQLGKSRNPTHALPLLIATRKNIPFSLPAIIIYDEKLTTPQRYFEYISPEELEGILM